MENIAVFDTETTGLVPGQHAIIEVGVVLADYQTLRETHRWEQRVKLAGWGEVDARALEVNRRSRESLDEGAPWREVRSRLRELFAGRIVLGHNVAFDLAHVVGMDLLEDVPLSPPPKSIDTASLAREVLVRRGDAVDARLDTLCDALGIGEGIAHTALGDCLRTLEVYRRIRKRLG